MEIVDEINLTEKYSRERLLLESKLDGYAKAVSIIYGDHMHGNLIMFADMVQIDRGHIDDDMRGGIFL